MTRATAEPMREVEATVTPLAAVDLLERIVGHLAGDAGGQGRLVVDRDVLPPAVRAALPADCTVIDGAGDGAGDGARGEIADKVSDAPATTALLMFDDMPSGADAALRLGRACRRFPGRVVVWQRDRCGQPHLDATEFFAHGFRRLLVGEADGVRHAVYEYRLADYKRPPDWLNARFWANPERFGVSD